jgi:hypothetical protein
MLLVHPVMAVRHLLNWKKPNTTDSGDVSQRA